MPIVSNSQNKKEENTIHLAVETSVQHVKKLEKKIQANTDLKEEKRKKSAKKIAIATAAGALFSCAVFLQVGHTFGILCAVMVSMLPTVTNLIDD
jgi:hypothetical protein